MGRKCNFAGKQKSEKKLRIFRRIRDDYFKTNFDPLVCVGGHYANICGYLRTFFGTKSSLALVTTQQLTVSGSEM